MKQLVAVALLVFLVVSCDPGERADAGSTTPPTGNDAAGETGATEPAREQIEAVQKEMAQWAEGHWTEHSAVWSPESGTVTLSATAAPDAGADAIKSYCRILNDIAGKHLPGVKVSTAVYFQSGAKIECK